MSIDTTKRTVISMAAIRSKISANIDFKSVHCGDAAAAVPVPATALSEETFYAPSTAKDTTGRASTQFASATQQALNRQARRRLGVDLSQPALLRLADVLKLYRVSRSTWYAGIKSGLYEPGIPIGPRCVAWRSEYILALLANPPKFVRA